MNQSVHWSSHYTVQQAPIDLNEGDKVILPSSALEQLVSKFNSDTSLPSPLTFELKHPHNGTFIHCGVKEFSSSTENVIQLPVWMMHHLQINQNDNIVIQLDLLPKGTWARLKPISNDYRDIQDYRAALEAHLRSHYHTLSKNQTIQCRYGGHAYQFQVMDVKPQDAVSITDTDLEVDIDPIDEQQQQTIPKSVSLNDIVEGLTLLKDQYQYYTFNVPENGPSTIAIQCQVSQGNIGKKKKKHHEIRKTHLITDIVASSVENKPTLENNEWADLTSNKERKLMIDTGGIKKIHFGFHGYDQQSKVDQIQVVTSTHDDPMETEQEDRTGKVQCDNCHQWILERTMMLHEGFCRRNNVLCEWGCGQIFKRDSEELKEHWHCDQCDYIGDGDREKHVEYFHTEKSCICQQFKTTSYTDLAEHRRTECPEKLIFCRYCHVSYSFFFFVIVVFIMLIVE